MDKATLSVCLISCHQRHTCLLSTRSILTILLGVFGAFSSSSPPFSSTCQRKGTLPSLCWCAGLGTSIGPCCYSRSRCWLESSRRVDLPAQALAQLVARHATPPFEVSSSAGTVKHCTGPATNRYTYRQTKSRPSRRRKLPPSKTVRSKSSDVFRDLYEQHQVPHVEVSA